MDTLINPDQKPAFMEKLRQEAEYELGQVLESSSDKSDRSSLRPTVPPAPNIPQIDEYGPQVRQENAAWKPCINAFQRMNFSVYPGEPRTPTVMTG